MDIKSINNSFINGFIPISLSYNASPEYNISIDVNKIQNNNYYPSYEFLRVSLPKVIIILLVSLM